MYIVAEEEEDEGVVLDGGVDVIMLVGVETVEELDDCDAVVMGEECVLSD